LNPISTLRRSNSIKARGESTPTAPLSESSTLDDTESSQGGYLESLCRIWDGLVRYTERRTEAIRLFCLTALIIRPFLHSSGLLRS
jgi:hypothetical protein